MLADGIYLCLAAERHSKLVELSLTGQQQPMWDSTWHPGRTCRDYATEAEWSLSGPGNDDCLRFATRFDANLLEAAGMARSCQGH